LSQKLATTWRAAPFKVTKDMRVIPRFKKHPQAVTPVVTGSGAGCPAKGMASFHK